MSDTQNDDFDELTQGDYIIGIDYAFNSNIQNDSLRKKLDNVLGGVIDKQAVHYDVVLDELETLIEQYGYEQRIDEQTHTQADIDGNMEFWPDGVTVMSQLERLAELERLKGVHGKE